MGSRRGSRQHRPRKPRLLEVPQRLPASRGDGPPRPGRLVPRRGDSVRARGMPYAQRFAPCAACMANVAWRRPSHVLPASLPVRDHAAVPVSGRRSNESMTEWPDQTDDICGVSELIGPCSRAPRHRRHRPTEPMAGRTGGAAKCVVLSRCGLAVAAGPVHRRPARDTSGELAGSRGSRQATRRHDTAVPIPPEDLDTALRGTVPRPSEHVREVAAAPSAFAAAHLVAEQARVPSESDG